MRVADLAKEMNISEEIVLKKLKALRLKSKGPEKELNAAVAAVVRGELVKAAKEEEKPTPKKKSSIKEKDTPQTAPAETEPEPAPAEAGEKEAAAEKEEKVKPRATKKTATKKATAKKTPPAATKKTAKKTTSKTETKEASAEDEKTTEKKSSAPAPEVRKPKTKPKPKISDAPFVALKPLAKKRRRPSGKTSDDSSSSSTSATERHSSHPPAETPIIDEDSLIPIEIQIPITVKDFAVRIEQKPSAILKKLLQMGIFANINQGLDEDIVKRVARDFGYNVTKTKTQEEQLIETHREEDENPELLQARAPVITFMGHVDHGKTSLLDRIRQTKVADTEHGGITQHIGAYAVKLPKGQITFLDTPGHEAFTAMRARGAHITDLAVIVIAAEEGLMPQTREAIDHARAADVPIVIALNKIDKPNADPDRVKKQLAEIDLSSEDWGGKTVVAPVSAKTGEGIDNLLELILLEAELLELKANPDKLALGIVVEAHLSQGRGAVASLIVQSGTLHVNDFLVVGSHYGKVKALFNDLEKPIDAAGPSAPVEILGLSSVPEAGEMFYVVEDEKRAREITSKRQQLLRKERLQMTKKLSLEDLYSQIQEGTIKELNVILKADVQGSLEALKDSLEKIPSEEVKVKFIHMGVGDVNASDVILAVASNAIIIAFQVGVGPRAVQELEKQPVDVRQYRIIYDAVDDMRKALEGMLAPQKRRNFLAQIEVRQVFKLSRSGLIAGCFVKKGKVPRKAQVDVVRNGEVIHSGTISSLKRFKDDVREVAEGYECGVALEGFTDYQPGDILEAYEIEHIARTL